MRMKTRAEAAVVAWAIRWWKTKRPESFSAKDHEDSPAVNTSTQAESELAWAVANVLRRRREARRKP